MRKNTLLFVVLYLCVFSKNVDKTYAYEELINEKLQSLINLEDDYLKRSDGWSSDLTDDLVTISKDVPQRNVVYNNNNEVGFLLDYMSDKGTFQFANKEVDSGKGSGMMTDDNSERFNSEVGLDSIETFGSMEKKKYDFNKGQHHSKNKAVPLIGDYFTNQEVTQHFQQEFSYIPTSVVNLTQQQSSIRSTCRDLSVNLFQADVNSLSLPYKINPKIGICPSVLKIKNLQTDGSIFPSRIVEVECLCNSVRCSRRGLDYRCRPIVQNVKVWYKHGNTLASMYRNITVGCACMQKLADASKMISGLFQIKHRKED